VALKKSELYSSLWQSCDALRGGMDASEYKNYVLAMLFVKYISDKFAGKAHAEIQVPPGASFADMVLLKGNKDIGNLINTQILRALELSNNKLSEFADFNDSVKLGEGAEKVDRLTKLIALFENPALDFSKNRGDDDDLLGDAYEFLMRHFATESGKSKGQFYTPSEVSRTMAQLLGLRSADLRGSTTVYDPTCGSGSLLLKVGEEARHIKPGVKLSLFGQEKDSSTAGLARMNTILHDHATAVIEQGNTLANPLFKNGNELHTFDFVIANPPFSDKFWSAGVAVQNDPYKRFEHFGAPPDKQGDYAYLLHILRSLKTTGRGACILPHGVLFRGNAEAAIRKNLIERGYIHAIIGLPANLFYGTGIPACIIVLDKNTAESRKSILMIDASKGFRKDGNKNRLRERDIHLIVDTFNRQLDVPGYARLVPVSEISDAKNDFNLNLPRYIDTSSAEDQQDLAGHLQGGIPKRDIDAFDAYWQVLPSVRSKLFAPLRSHYVTLKVPATEVKAIIFRHAEFDAFKADVLQRFRRWHDTVEASLSALKIGSKPKQLIETISESLLVAFQDSALIDAYAIYQHLMDYWQQTLQDDCYLIAADGWKEAAKPRLIIEEKAKDKNSVKIKQRVDLIVNKAKYQMELLPTSVLIAAEFSDAQAALDALDSELSQIVQQLESLSEEHSGEDGLLESAKNDAGKLTKASVQARAQEIERDKSLEDERAVLAKYLALLESEAKLAAQLKVQQAALDGSVLKRYGSLTEAQIKNLVVQHKWLATVEAAVNTELERVSQALSARIRELAERYAKPLSELEAEFETLAARVQGHLARMGLRL
jgi:type I restriction enzyme M protein